MTSIDQTSLILLALDKALIDNYRRLKQGEGEALLLAAFKTIVGAPAQAEAKADNNERKVDERVYQQRAR